MTLKNQIALHLEDLFEKSFVVQEYKQNGLVLEYCIIREDKLIEVEQINRKEDIVDELAKIGRIGSRHTFNKHKKIRTGEFLSNAFYFLCPDTVKITLKDIPDGYGIISYKQHRNGTISLKTIEEATYIHNNYLSKNFYITLSRRLNEQVNHLTHLLNHNESL